MKYFSLLTLLLASSVVLVNTVGNEHAAAIEKFSNDLNLDSKFTTGSSQQKSIPTQPPANMNGNITMNDYAFIAPEGWLVQKNKDHIQIQNLGSGCVIRILEPQPSSGDLERDAKNVFNVMYAGWQYQKAGEQQFDMSTGFLSKGLMYCMMEAPMSMTTPDGRYNTEEGAALIIQAGDQIVIVSVRHNDAFLAHGDCERKYETWRRFFNSFTVKNVTLPKNTEEESSKKIIGVWKLTGHGPALGEYVFAANGNYRFGGAIGTSSTTSDYRYEYLHITSYAFDGDGSYTIAGNQLYFKKRGEKNSEQVQFRFEKVKHGHTGWNDRLYMLERDMTLGSQYEVCYEKKNQ